MRRVSHRSPLAGAPGIARTGAILRLAALIALASPASAQDINPAAASPGWYIGAAAGASRGPTLNQQGWNQETYCYPDSACFDQNPIPGVPGYRWSYDIERDASAGFEVFAGRRFGPVRLELAVAAQRNDANQQFTGISYFDGAPILPRPGGTVVSNSRADVDHFNARSFMLNAYYDFLSGWGDITPYVGAGLGLAALELAGVHFSTDYQDPAGGSYDPPLSFYNTIQSEDFRGTRVKWAIYAGADVPIATRLLLGIRLSYSGSGGFEDTGAYEIHPFKAQEPGFANTTRLSGPRDFAAALTLKRLIGS